MDNQDKNLNSIHDSVIAMLDLIQQHQGRDAAHRLLMRIQNTFNNHGVGTIQRKDTGAYRELFVSQGGYDLTGAQVMLQHDGVIRGVVAFGILPTEQGKEPRLNFLLANGEEVDYSLRELSRYGFNSAPTYQSPTTLIFLPTKDARWDARVANDLIEQLRNVKADKLAEAFSKLNPFALHGVTDDVPKQELITLTQEERDTLAPIDQLQFVYMDTDEPVLRITPVEGGFVFHTPTQSVQLASDNVDVSFVHEPKPREGYWLLMVVPDTGHGGVTLTQVLELGQDDLNREFYAPLIGIFNRQFTEHQQRLQQ